MTDKYQTVKIIGKGSRACVYLVRNKDTDALLAMKIYRTENASSNEAERELLVLKQIKGTGIPYLTDCIRSENAVCIFMEYIEGRSLRQLMDEKHIFDEGFASDVAYKIAEILSLFHTKIPAWIYMDLKPENIMVSDKGELYLVDFGSVLISGEKNHSVLGTKAYSPEEEYLTPYRDTYAIGVILYEMLTGYTYAVGIKSGKADLSYLSKSCQKILQKAVKMNPEKGYCDAPAMKEDIRRWQENLREKTERGEAKKKGGIFMKKHQKTYYIGDTRRFIRHGLLKYTAELAICILIIVFAVYAEGLLKIKEIEAAEGAGMTESCYEEVSEEFDVYAKPIGIQETNKVVVVHQLIRN